MGLEIVQAIADDLEPSPVPSQPSPAPSDNNGRSGSRPDLKIQTQTPPPAPAPAPAKSSGQWALPTPGPRPEAAAGWTMFSMDSPAAPTPAISGNRISAANSAHTSAGSSSRADDEEGYFSTKASSSQTSTSPSPQVKPKPQLPPLAPGLADLGLGAVKAGSSLTQDRASLAKASQDVQEAPLIAVAPTVETEAELGRPQASAGLPKTEESTHVDPETRSVGTMSDDDSDDTTEAMPSPPQPTSPPAATAQAEPVAAQRPSLLAPGSSSSRPSLYSRPSRSMVNLSTSASATDAASSQSSMKTESPLLPTRSRERRPPTKIKIPAQLMRPEAILTPSSEWKRAPPTPAAGFAGYLASRSRVNVSQVPPTTPLGRRRSADDLLQPADDLLQPPPEYAPPLPGTYIPRPREEEGMENLPGYWCAVSTVAPCGDMGADVFSRSTSKVS